MFNIGILGSGVVGTTLALGLEEFGYSISVGSRSLPKLEEWKESSGFKGSIGSYEEAAAYGDVLILAVKGSIAENVLQSAQRENFKQKVILDATNPIEDIPPEDGVLQFFTSANFSLMERLQSQFHQARFVKCFSHVGAQHMISPEFGVQKPSMFICGNDPEAKEIASSIVEMCGFIPEDMGSAKSAGAIESLAILRCIPGFREGKRNHAFKLLQKD